MFAHGGFWYGNAFRLSPLEHSQPAMPHIKSRGEEQTGKRKHGRPGRRWVVERIASWINRFRRLLVRWETKAANFLAMLHRAFAYAAWRQTRSRHPSHRRPSNERHCFGGKDTPRHSACRKLLRKKALRRVQDGPLPDGRGSLGGSEGF